MDNKEYLEFDVTCKTANCENESVKIRVQSVSPAVVWCGVCSTEITDIQPVNLDLERTQE